MKEKLFIDATKENSFKEKYELLIKRKKDYQISYFNNEFISDYRVGEYYTINYDIKELYKNNIEKEIKNILIKLLKKYNNNYKTLIIGLGNEEVTADSIGPIIGKKIIASNQYNDFLTIPNVAIFNPSTINNTGINPYKLIKMVVNYLKPNMIIIIDSCITNNIDNIARSIEINDAGMIYGESINYYKSINKDTFNIPIISILIPLLYNNDNIKLTIPNIHEVSNLISNIVSNAINNIYFH